MYMLVRKEPTNYHSWCRAIKIVRTLMLNKFSAIFSWMDERIILKSFHFYDETAELLGSPPFVERYFQWKVSFQQKMILIKCCNLRTFLIAGENLILRSGLSTSAFNLIFSQSHSSSRQALHKKEWILELSCHLAVFWYELKLWQTFILMTWRLTLSFFLERKREKFPLIASRTSFAL